MAARGRWASRLAVAVAVVLALGAGFWAGSVTLRPPAVQAPKADAAVVVTVSEQTVGKVLSYNVTAKRARRVLAVNSLTGVVTRVQDSGRFRTGDELYRVANVPVRVVEGRVPFYRALQADVRGHDVVQLKAALQQLGYLTSSAQGGNRYDWATVVAVRAWQKKLGMTQTGTVALGELIAVKALPAQLVIDGDIARAGASLSGGEQIVASASEFPKFSLELQQEQAKLIPLEATVTVRHSKYAWPAVITGSSSDAQGGVTLTLAAPKGGPICGKHCGSLPAAATSYLLSDVAVVKPAKGPAVPVAGITTQPDGSTTVLVVDPSGARTQRTVKVRASQDGVAIVDGVKPGERVQVLAEQGGATPTLGQPSATSSGR